MVQYMPRVYGIDELSDIIAKSTKQSSRFVMTREEAEPVADHILGFFGYQNRIIDNMLDPSDRNLFYQLQDLGILDTESEETKLIDGRQWRIHYWKFNDFRIDKILNDEYFKEEIKETNIYDDIFKTVNTVDDDEVWLPKKIEDEDLYRRW